MAQLCILAVLASGFILRPSVAYRAQGEITARTACTTGACATNADGTSGQCQCCSKHTPVEAPVNKEDWDAFDEMRPVPTFWSCEPKMCAEGTSCSDCLCPVGKQEKVQELEGFDFFTTYEWTCIGPGAGKCMKAQCEVGPCPTNKDGTSERSDCCHKFSSAEHPVNAADANDIEDCPGFGDQARRKCSEWIMNTGLKDKDDDNYDWGNQTSATRAKWLKDQRGESQCHDCPDTAVDMLFLTGPDYRHSTYFEDLEDERMQCAGQLFSVAQVKGLFQVYDPNGNRDKMVCKTCQQSPKRRSKFAAFLYGVGCRSKVWTYYCKKEEEDCKEVDGSLDLILQKV